MRETNMFIFLVAIVLLTPAMAMAGDTGACMAALPDQQLFPEGKGGCNAVCVDGLTEQECNPVNRGLYQWFEGETCASLDVPWTWEGGCQADVDPFGDQCYVIECGGDADLACAEESGIWYEGDLACGLGVPTMPGFGMAALAFLILGGALVLLAARGSLPSA